MKTTYEMRRAAPGSREDDPDITAPCSAPQRELNAYLDRELPIAAQRAMELRLAADSELRSRVAEMNEIRAMVMRAYGATLKR